MASKQLKVAVIGVGGIARTHMPGWIQSPHTEVVAGSDISEEALKAWGQQHGVKKLVTDPQKLLEDDDVDIVDICTPSSYHAPLTVAALEAGKHVICEKPLAPTPDEIRQMIAARDKAGKMLMTAQHFRFNPTAAALKAELETGVLGEIYHARSWMLRRAATPVRPSFLQKQHAGGGPCIDIGVHILDLTLWMMGHPRPVSVTGVARREQIDKPGAWSIWGGAIPTDAIDVEDFASAFVRFDNGATLILEVSWMLHHDTKGKAEDMQMWLYGKEGGAHWPDCTVLQTSNQPRQHYDRQLKWMPTGAEAHAAECMAFAEAIARQQASPVPAEQSLMVQTILDGLYRSHQTGAEVKLD